MIATLVDSRLTRSGYLLRLYRTRSGSHFFLAVCTADEEYDLLAAGAATVTELVGLPYAVGRLFRQTSRTTTFSALTAAGFA